jgi:Putative MetA-pathway of phenol degradation
MIGMRYRGPWGLYGFGAAAAVLLLAGLAGGVRAQGTPNGGASPSVLPAAPPAVAGAPTGDGVVQTGCASCGSGLLGGGPPPFGAPGGCDGCGACGGGCNGHRPCDCCCDGENCVARLFCGFYQCVCCPDPCYEPRWNALADSAFFTEAPRPITQMRLRYDNVWKYPFPDKAEFLFPRSDGNGKGPRPLPGTLGGGNVHYQDFMYYQEVGIDRFSASVELPYNFFSPDNYHGASGFGDMSIGTKSMLLDCELLQFTFGFKTFIPTGNFTKGLGTGHVSLEPSFMAALKLAPETYLQAQLAYRFPLGGNGDYEGPVLHYHLSLNQILWHCGNDIKLIGVAELNGYEFLGGEYTSDAGVPLSAKGSVGDVVSIGPGVRLVICDKIDFGIGSAFNITSGSVGDEWLRIEFRWRF